MTSIRCFLSRVAAGIQACKFAAIPVLALSLALVTTSAKAQTFKSDFATQVVLAGGGTDPVNTLTLLASPSTKPLMLTFPNAATAGTYVLSSDGSGHLVWANGSAGITLGGDVTGAANANTIASTAGPDIAVAINAGAASAIDGSQVNPNFVAQNVSTTGTISGDGITSTVATGNALSLDNTGTPGAGVNDVTGTGGLWYVTNLGAATFASVNAGSGAITNTGNAQIGTGGSTTNDFGTGIGATNTIGVGGLTQSSTTINGALNITGTVAFTTAPTIPLPQSELFLGNASGDATAVTMGGDATIAFSGPSSGNVSITASAGNDIVLALNNASTTDPINTPVGITAASLTTTGAVDGGSGVFTGTLGVTGNTSLSTVSTSGLATLNSLTTASATITGGTIDGTAIGSTNPSTGAFTNLTSTGNTNINTPASAGIVVATTNIDAGPGQEGVVNIGNNGGATPADSSTTNIAGALNISGATNFTGPVNIPAGDLNLGLATNNIYIGNGSNIATGAPVTGDVSATLTSGNAVLDVNSVQTAAGNSIVAAINGSTTNLSNTGISITAGAITGSSLTTTGAVDGGTGVFTSTVSAAGVTSTAGLTSGGGSSNLNNADNDAVNIGSGASETNAIAIGNGTGNSGTFSTTTLAGLIDITGDANFTGPVNIPAGDLNLGLAQNNIFVGNISNIAAPLAPTDSRVLVTDVSGNVSWGSTLPTGLTVSGETMNNETIGGTTSISTSGSIATTGSGSLSVAGQTTLASTNLSSQGVTAAATTALSNGSFFQLTCLSSVAITTLTGGNIGTAGQIIVLLNANASGSGIYITLTAGGTLALNGGNVIMGPGGSATLISDGTNWHLMSAE